MQKLKKLFCRFTKSLFWLWNVALLVFVGFGFIPFLFLEFAQEVYSGIMPPEYLFFSTILILIAPVSMLVALKKCRSMLDYALVFYGIEMPVFFLTVIRIFIMRDLTPATWFLAAIMIVSSVACLIGVTEKFKGRFAKSYLVSSQIGLWFACYVALLTLFFVIPFSVLIPIGIFEGLGEFFRMVGRMEFAVFLLYFFIYGGFLATIGLFLFILFPPMLIITYYGNFKRAIRPFSLRTQVLSTGMVAICLTVIFGFANRQPQIPFMAMADKELLDEEIIELSHRQSEVRRGLLNAYLSPYRYFDTVQDNNHMGHLYQTAFGRGLSFDFVQAAYVKVLSPFFYQGDRMWKDQQRAEVLYRQLFDAEIQVGELDSVQNAMNSTFNRRSSEAGLLDKDEETVWMVEQEVKTNVVDGMAKVEVREVFENKTGVDKEIVYYFRLDKSAVITGVWLSQEGDPDKYFAYTVAPRGAAQQVYRSEVRRQIDPAIVEKVGPENYRLKVFPVEGRLGTKAKRTTLWFSYVAPLKNGIEQPVLIEKRNVFWNHDTLRTIDNKPVKSDQWIPKIELPSIDSRDVSFEVERGIFVSSLPRHNSWNPESHERVAVVLDHSFSMRKYRDHAQKKLDKLVSVLDEKRIAFEVFQSKFNGINVSVNHEFNEFIGSINKVEALDRFMETVGKTKEYDAVYYLTDSDQEIDRTAELKNKGYPGPIWFLYVDDTWPKYLDDALSLAISRSGGGASIDVDELVLDSLCPESWLDDSGFAGDVISCDGSRVWVLSTKSPKKAVLVNKSHHFSKLAASRLIDYKSQFLGDAEPEALRFMHNIAKGFGVVSPWSSMIVLVNDRQRQLLANLSEKSDAFDRETETGVQVMSNPDIELVPGTPEPEEWALILVLLCLTAYGIKTGRIRVNMPGMKTPFGL